MFISRGISEIAPNLYRVDCECTSESHSVLLEVEHIEAGSLDVMFHIHPATPYQHSFFKRLGMAAAILFKGHYKMEHSIVLHEKTVDHLKELLFSVSPFRKTKPAPPPSRRLTEGNRRK